MGRFGRGSRVVVGAQEGDGLCRIPSVARAIVDRLSDVMPPPYRASIGLAVWDGTESTAELLARADAQMYERKAASRSAGRR
jgi:GGDEF domain-containing protein